MNQTSEGNIVEGFAHGRPLNVAVFGAAGRMGKALIRCLPRFKGMALVAAVEQPGHAALGKDAGVLAGHDPLGITISCDHYEARAADVLIDFSFHGAVPRLLETAIRLEKRVVLGTTGLTDDESRAVHDAAKRTAVLWAPNMSSGVNLLFGLVEQAARVLGPEYDVEIVEIHHRHKKDAPSGTALKFGEIVARARGQSLASVLCYGRAGNVGERPQGQIGIHAVRSGDVVGDHIVSFGTDGERIEFVHRAASREAFAMGALRAACWIADKPPGLYDMQHVLGFKR